MTAVVKRFINANLLRYFLNSAKKLNQVKSRKNKNPELAAVDSVCHIRSSRLGFVNFVNKQ